MGHTISSHIQINDIADADVDHTKEALVLLFELLLIKDLDGENAVFSDSPSPIVSDKECTGSRRDCDEHIKDLIPIRIQGLPDYRGGPGLLP